MSNKIYNAQMIKERMSVSTLIFWRYRPLSEDSLNELVQHGINRIELLESPERKRPLSNRDIEFQKRLCRKVRS